MTETIGIDFETYLIDNKEPAPKPVCLSYYVEGTSESEAGVWVGLEQIEKGLKVLLEGDYKIVAHNMAFEALVINRWFPDLRERLFSKLKAGELLCTETSARMISNSAKKPRKKFDLASEVKAYFKIDISDAKKDPEAWRLRYSELEGVPLEDWPESAVSYAKDDSIWAVKVFSAQKEAYRVGDLEADLKENTRAYVLLNHMGQFGLHVDLDRVETLKQECLTKLEPPNFVLNRLQLLNIQDFAGLDKEGKPKWKPRFSPNAWRRDPQACEAAQQEILESGELKTNPLARAGIFKKKLDIILEKKLEGHVKRTTDKGNLGTSKDDLTFYLSQLENDELIGALLRITEFSGVLSKFTSRLEKADPVIRTSYKPVVSSGRTSSSGSSAYPSVNMQQMPREVKDVTWDVRNCFVPRPGFKICCIDYNGLELASTAHQLYSLTGLSSMRDIVNSGNSPVDMHSMLAYRVMNLKEGTKETYESFVANKKLKEYASYRQLSKPINLGFPGGIGYDTMRTLLAKEGIYPKLVVVDTATCERALTFNYRQARNEGYPVRIRRVGFREFQLVYDELVLLKGELFKLYPDLEAFLKEGHKEYLTGETKAVKNDYGEWEQEPMYAFQVGDFKRDFCMYTQVCNGMLMQSPAAIGAKAAMCDIIDTYRLDPDVNPLAFIHDEIVFEVRDCPRLESVVADVSERLIDNMQIILSSVRIAVEAEVFPYWKKAGGEWDKTYFKDPCSEILQVA